MTRDGADPGAKGLASFPNLHCTSPPVSMYPYSREAVSMSWLPDGCDHYSSDTVEYLLRFALMVHVRRPLHVQKADHETGCWENLLAPC
jgi:hypothetical protein